ncbi:MAG: OmpA family protein [Ilumatobacter sp.]|jgi:chemotaxis protein MotB|uniref:OmpA family protein n=1 Tax=Ilumatobacter sp. TaxID=1967498 RepID=UPI00391C0950
MSESRGKKRGHEEEHEEHVNHEAWVIPYADVLTLLMALFLVLWALGDTNEEKTEIAAESFRRELGGSGGISSFDIGEGTGGGPLANGGISILEGNGPAPMSAESDPNALGASQNENGEDEVLNADGLPSPGDREVFELDPVVFDPIDHSGEVLGDPLSEVERTIRENAIGSGLNTVVGARRESRGLVVTIVSDSVLFLEGQAAVQPDGITILGVIADSLRELPNSLIVEGHTDSRPISTARYPSNWELSTARATSVLRYLVEEQGMPADRVAAAGYADTRPIADGSDAESLARNRRVEIVVLATA